MWAKKTPVRIFFLVFFLVAAGLLIAAGALALGGFTRQANGVETTAVVTGYGPNGYPVLAYETADGRPMQTELNFSSSEIDQGERITIYYDPADPAAVTTGTWKLVAIILGSIGGVFLLIALAVLGTYGFKGGRLRKLSKRGMLVYADIEQVRLDHTLSVNGRHPFRIDLLYYDAETSKDYLFKTRPLWTDPGPEIEARRLSSLPVYIDPKNPNKYAVSLEDFAE